MEQSHPEELKILYQSNSVFVIEKPRRCHSTALQNSPEHHSMAAALLAQFPELAEVSPKGREDGGLVQRLDFETSGALLVARGPQIWQQLHQELKTGTIEKEYLVVVHGQVDAPIKSRGWIGSRGRSSKTVRFFFDKPPSKFRSLPAELSGLPLAVDAAHNRSLLLVAIEGGRRHQIRAQLAALGTPLVGDPLYGGSNADISENFCLHAFRTTFTDPDTKNRITITAPIPAYFPMFDNLDYQKL